MAEGTNLIIVDSSTFGKEVEESTLPMLLDFYAEWCGPCKMMAPIFAELAAEYEGKLRFAKLDIDQNQQIAVKFNVMSIPTLILFENGAVVDRIIGFSNKADLKTRIDELLTKV